MRYKAVEPEETISHALNVLHSVGLDVQLTEHSAGGVYSCEVSFAPPFNLLPISTSGKGRSVAYARASGLAELLERIQCGILFENAFDFVRSTLPTDHPHARNHDYIYKDADELVCSLGDDLQSLCGAADKQELRRRLLSFSNGQPLACESYEDVFTGQSILIPTKFITRYTTSNGMCAGNTDAEAESQGLCELMERYALRELYFREITPPLIAWEHFSALEDGDALVKKLQRTSRLLGVQFAAYDLSLQQSLPVVMLLCLVPGQGQYAFKLGCDLSPVVALERCFTELMQGGEQNFAKRLCSVSQSLDFTSEKDRQISHYLSWRSGQGPLPAKVLQNLFAHPSYDFKGFHSARAASDLDDLTALRNIVKANHASLWRKNRGYLGFPTWHTIIPQWSLLDLTSESRAAHYDQLFLQKETLWHACDMDPSRLQIALNTMCELQSDFAPRLQLDLHHALFSWSPTDPQNLALKLALKLGDSTRANDLLRSMLPSLEVQALRSEIMLGHHTAAKCFSDSTLALAHAAFGGDLQKPDLSAFDALYQLMLTLDARRESFQPA